MKRRGAPVAAPDDGAIQLDGDARFGKIKLGDELSQGERIGEFSGLAVDVNAQFLYLAG